MLVHNYKLNVLDFYQICIIREGVFITGRSHSILEKGISSNGQKTDMREFDMMTVSKSCIKF